MCVVCFSRSLSLSLSLQCLLSKLIRASQLRSQRGERHSELLPSLSVSPPYSFLPSSSSSFPVSFFIFSYPISIVLPFYSRPFLLPSRSIIPSSPISRHRFHQPAFSPPSLHLLSSLPSPSGLCRELDKWAGVDGWGWGGQEDFQSTQWNLNSSWDCVEAATGSRRVLAEALLASGRVLSRINTWPRARASRRSFLCAFLPCSLSFLSSHPPPFSSPAESGKSLPLRIHGHQARFPRPNQPHPSARLRSSLAPPNPFEPR